MLHLPTGQCIYRGYQDEEACTHVKALPFDHHYRHESRPGRHGHQSSSRQPVHLTRKFVFINVFDRFSKLSYISWAAEQLVKQTSEEEDSFDIDD
jgi:hypothetical protein